MIPKGLSKAELLEVLGDMHDLVSIDDSFEGSIEYLIPDPEGPNADADFEVRASYRVGNRDGQGGVRMVGVIE